MKSSSEKDILITETGEVKRKEEHSEEQQENVRLSSSSSSSSSSSTFYGSESERIIIQHPHHQSSLPYYQNEGYHSTKHQKLEEEEEEEERVESESEEGREREKERGQRQGQGQGRGRGRRIERDDEIGGGENKEELEVEVFKNVKVYQRRWIMLGLFCFLTCSNALVWSTPQPVTESFRQWYQVSNFAVNTLSMVFMLVYVVGLFPALFVLGNCGTRITLLIGAGLTLLGATVRGIPGSGFSVVVLGQTIAAAGQCFTLGAPPQMAAVWFPPEERGKATGIGTLFNTLGAALSFLIGPSFANNISLLLTVNTAVCCLMAILLLLFFEEKPPLPPSIAQSDDSFSKEDLKSLFTNGQFMLFACGIGLAIGSFWAVPTMLSQSLVPQGYTEDDAGLLGLVLIGTGMVGTLSAGFILDRFSRWHKWLVIGAGLLGGVALLGYTAAMRPGGLPFLYLCVGAYGLLLSTLIPLGMEAAADSVFPIPEPVSSGVIMIPANLFSLLLTIAMSLLQTPDGSTLISNIVATITVFTGIFMLFCWKFERKRTMAESSHNLANDTLASRNYLDSASPTIESTEG